MISKIQRFTKDGGIIKFYVKEIKTNIFILLEMHI